MQIFPPALNLEHYPRAGALSYLAADGSNQRLDIGKYDVSASRDRVDRFQRLAVFGFHNRMIAKYAISCNRMLLSRGTGFCRRSYL